MQQSSFKQQLTGLLLLTTVLFGNLSAFAQKKAVAAATAQTAGKNGKSPQSCNSGYVGSVNYTKVTSTGSDGRYGSYANMKRTYQATINVRDDGRQQGSVMMSEGQLMGSFSLSGQSTASQTEITDQLQVSEKDDYCKLTLRGADGKTRVHCESKFTRNETTTGISQDASVYIGIKGNKINLSIGNLPKLNGTMSENSSSKCSGMCGKDTPLNSSRSSEVTGAGERSAATEEDKLTFDPTNFNRLSGSWSKVDSTPGGTVTETMNWNLSRCAPPLQIDNIHFEQKRVLSPNDWIGVDSLAGATDGNIVKIKATVFNSGGETAYANVKFTETKSGEALPNGTVSVAVKPGESREVEYEWDTSGYSWDENQTKLSEREIKAEVPGDSQTAKITITPKPVILVHGLWSNAAAWSEWHGYLREAHSFAWNAYPVGEDTYHGKMNTGDHAGNWDPTNSIFQNAQELGKQIKFVREQQNAWHVDLVVHSMGGLISRFYIHNFMAPVYDGKPEATHLVMLGTPNQGSACADLMYGVFNYKAWEKPVEALRQLKPSVVEEYNKKTYNRKGVKFSILAGFGAGPTCGLEIGDGVVPLSSALYNIADRGYAGTHHLALTDKQYFQSFVMPRIAIGPKKARAEQATAELNIPFTKDGLIDKDLEINDPYGYAKYFRNASYKSGEQAAATTDDDPKNLTVRTGVELAPKEIKEIDIPVRDGSSAGVVLMAQPYIAATLTDAGGASLGSSPVNDGGLLNTFRTIAVQKEIKNGVWKLKLENTSTVAAVVLVAGFTNSGATASFTVEAGKPTAAGQVPLTAKLLVNNAPAAGAKVTADIVGQPAAIEFFDDGKHGDGAAGDGIYGALTEKLGRGDYYVEAKAEASNQTQVAVAEFSIGGAAVTAKPAVAPAAKSTAPAARRVRKG